MEIVDTTVDQVIQHRDYNLEKIDNLDVIPAEKALFGVFAIVNDEPVNCRYVGQSENLRQSIQLLFTNPEGSGLKIFMQGPWIKKLRYELMPGSTTEERREAVIRWAEKYHPAIADDGEYPGYY